MTYYIVGIHRPDIHDSAIVELRTEKYAPMIVTATVGELKRVGSWKTGAKFNFAREGELRDKIASGKLRCHWHPAVNDEKLEAQPLKTEKITVIEYSVEQLYHFSCSNCSQWWTIGDYTPYPGMTCPHCGTYHNVIHPKAKLEDTKPSNDKLVALLRDHIPKGYGYNSEYAMMLEEAASRLERL